MNSTEPTETRPAGVRSKRLIQMPLGLLGFEKFKRYALVSQPAEAPFHWLRILDGPKLAFLAMSPFLVQPGYAPEISPEDSQFLELQTPKEALFLNIVTVRSHRQATVNLKGPIVLNTRTLRAKQVIPLNASEFSVAQSLPIQAV
jgi:flagellar assembly factor FliW